ncbi:MAG: hypothetical protein V4457_06505 [Pseudomonadota bacterium]
MRLIIRDTWFPVGTRITIGSGQDELVFVRCTFEGGEIAVDAAIEQPIFAACLFQGTRFSGQPLSARISHECQWCASVTEAAVSVGLDSGHVAPK